MGSMHDNGRQYAQYDVVQSARTTLRIVLNFFENLEKFLRTLQEVLSETVQRPVTAAMLIMVAGKRVAITLVTSVTNW